MKILPVELKKQATQKLAAHIDWLVHGQKPAIRSKEYHRYFVSQWQACIDYLNSEDWTRLIPKFKEITRQLDQLRNEDCAAVFPELAPVLESD